MKGLIVLGMVWALAIALHPAMRSPKRIPAVVIGAGSYSAPIALQGAK